MADVRNNNGTPFIYPDWPAPNNVNAAMTTRHGGVSQSPFSAMNLGTHVDDRPDNVLKNRAILKQSLQLSSEPLWLNQIHGTEVIEHSSCFLGSDADAVYTHRANAVCAVMTADCLPVLFCNRQGTAIAAAHAGWRGLQAGILEQSIVKMDCHTDDILVWLGAAIGPNAFEVGNEVREAFISVHARSEAAFILKNKQQSKWLADIYQLATVHLTEFGIAAENIYEGGHCTYTDDETFFSYRREARTGRMASLIWLA